MSYRITRRRFMAASSVSAAGMGLGSGLAGGAPGRDEGVSNYDLMQDVMKYRKIDAHGHVRSAPGDAEQQIRFMDSLGIEKLTIVNAPSSSPPEKIRESNDHTARIVKQYPGRFIGFFTLNPSYQKESLEEIKRSVDQGLVGYKSYAPKVSGRLYFPIIERLIELKMIIHLHTNCQLGAGGYRMKYDVGWQYDCNLPEDLVEAAKRYPEAMFQYAHLGNGADWEYACKCIRSHPNIYVDTGGSNNEENLVDFAIRQLGEDRVFFGTDNCFHHGVGKILASKATEAQKRKIFFENFNNVLKKGGRQVA